MSLLRKLLQGGKKAAPSLQQRSTRIRLLLSDGARLETEQGEFPILNLSESGIGLLVEKGSLAGMAAGTLYLGSEKLAVQIEVVRQNASQVGARFLGDQAPLRRALRRQFTEEIQATEMSEVRSSHLSREERGNPRWFYAPSHYELFFLEEEGEVLKLQMEWNGRVLAAAKGEGARVGRIEPEDRQKPDHAKSSLIQWEREIAEADRQKAIRIIENIPSLEGAMKGLLVRMIRS